jgi:hypothetical protein
VRPHAGPCSEEAFVGLNGRAREAEPVEDVQGVAAHVPASGLVHSGGR